MLTELYLSRLGYTGPLTPNAETLHALHRAHLYCVPFENLDIHLGRAIRLDRAALFDKIVTRRRGGFCYELNGLFAWLLESMGFQVDLLSAASANDDGSFLADFEHMALRVICPDDRGQAWLADVGWGNGFLEPLRLEPGLVQRQSQRVYRLEPQEERLIFAEQQQPDSWLWHYRFSLQPRRLAEFDEMCAYMQSSPDSLFTQKQLCTRFSPDGRITLSNLKLITTGAGGLREERVLSGEAEARAVLKDLFGIDLMV